VSAAFTADLSSVALAKEELIEASPRTGLEEYVCIKIAAG